MTHGDDEDEDLQPFNEDENAVRVEEPKTAACRLFDPVGDMICLLSYWRPSSVRGDGRNEVSIERFAILDQAQIVLHFAARLLEPSKRLLK